MTPAVDRGVVIVIGGGAIGLAAAWRLADDGHDVVLCDPAPAMRPRTPRAGMIAPVSETHFGEEALQRLNLAGAARWPAFSVDLEAAAGAPSGYRRTGSLAVAFDADDKRELDRLHEHQVIGRPPGGALDRRRLPGTGAGALPRLRGGLWIEGDHQADNRQMARYPAGRPRTASGPPWSARR